MFDAGRGSSDDKGPVLGWLNVLQYHHEHKKELPVNLRFCFEGMEESGSEGLDELIQKEAQAGGWFDGVDCACIVRVKEFNLGYRLLISFTSPIITGSTPGPRF